MGYISLPSILNAKIGVTCHLCNSENGDTAWRSKNNSEWGLRFPEKKILLRFKKPKKTFKKNKQNRWVVFFEKIGFFSTLLLNNSHTHKIWKPAWFLAKILKQWTWKKKWLQRLTEVCRFPTTGWRKTRPMRVEANCNLVGNCLRWSLNMLFPLRLKPFSNVYRQTKPRLISEHKISFSKLLSWRQRAWNIVLCIEPIT